MFDLRLGLVAALGIFGSGLAEAAGEPPAASGRPCLSGPQCPYATFRDDAAHYQVEFAEPLIRLPADGSADGSADAAQMDAGSQRTSFSSADGKFQLDIWSVPNRTDRKKLDAPPAPGSRIAEGWRVTYRASGESWTVASGFTQTGHVFYERTDLTCGGATVAGFVAVYPDDAASRARFDKWIEKTRVGSFRCAR